MRILVDTNVLFSALLFPNSKPAQALLYITRNHEMYLSDQNISELKEILSRKRPDKLPELHVFLSELSYTIISAVYSRNVTMRDAKDQPILNAAIAEDVDVILTGDKDFLSLALNRPECLSVTAFCEKYVR